jgi:DNA-binding PadR family transcriptional regulator
MNTAPAAAPQTLTGPDFLSRAYWNGTIKMSLSKFFILRALHQGPLHGYDIAGAVERLTNGCCSPTEGTIYPVLRQYEEGGYVTGRDEVVGGRRRRVYALTDKGREAFGVAVAAWMEITECLRDCCDVVGAPAHPGGACRPDGQCC